MLTMAGIATPPRWVCPNQAPIGMARVVATSIVATEICRCSHSRGIQPGTAVPWAVSSSKTLSANQLPRSIRKSIIELPIGVAPTG